MAKLVPLALAYNRDFIAPTLQRRKPEGVEVAALERLGIELAGLPADATAEDIQNIVYTIGNEGGFESLRDWFKALYETLLGSSAGPSHGQLHCALWRGEQPQIDCGGACMTVIAARIYRDGRLLSEADAVTATPKLEQKDDFVWIGLHEPDDALLQTISKNFGLHELAVEDALDPRHLPKMESYGDHLFVVARTLHLEGDDGHSRIAYGNTALFRRAQFHHHCAPRV